MKKDLKELLRTIGIFFMLIAFYFCISAFIDFSVERSRKPSPPPPTYGEIIVNDLA